MVPGISSWKNCYSLRDAWLNKFEDCTDIYAFRMIFFFTRLALENADSYLKAVFAWNTKRMF
jgi:hypothetical protein